MTCHPAFDYARTPHTVERDAETVWFVPQSGGQPRLRLWANVPLQVNGPAAVAELKLSAGQSAAFILDGHESGGSPAPIQPAFVSEAFLATVDYWRNWIGQSRYQGRWRNMVNRSALTLKLLTSKDHGSFVASPTFGLPEQIGGKRNWDYRYTWIRDASFSLYGLLRLGFTEEAAAFMRWLEARCREISASGPLQTIYGLDGRKLLTETVLEQLSGYRNSSPVRIGNGAYQQLQLDIYGELMDSVYLYEKYGSPISHDLWQSLAHMLDWLAENWTQPDNGIWEVRGGRGEFLISRLMTWVAFDRAIRLAKKRSFPAPIQKWQAIRDQIYQEIFTDFWDARQKAFIQSKGSHALDAASLLMPLMRFISPVDPRWLFHLKAIERGLAYDSLIKRYNIGQAAKDGLAGDEGTFSMCSFWYTECLSRSGQPLKARFYFEKMLGYANHLGLYSEQLGPRGEHLGNFPQAFTHLALISAAYEIDRRLTAASRHS
jgi:GH15 family glucan-1,4-alpha-glucosidase